MGQWTTQFGGAEFVGVLPPDFEEQFDTFVTELPIQRLPVTANVVGRYVLRAEDNNVTHKLLRWIRPQTNDDVTDTDQLLLFRVTETPGNQMCRIWCRASGGDGTENGYCVVVGQSGTANMSITTFTAGTPTVLAQDLTLASPSSFLIDTPYWLQFRVVGDLLQARVWAYGTTAPALWDLEVTDSTHTAEGWIGPGSSTSLEIEYDYYSVGTRGDTPQYVLPTAVNPGNSNVLVAIPDQVQTDGTVFLVYTGEPNVAVDWNLTGDGTLTVLTDQTDAAGKATARYTPGTVGAHNIDVTVGV